MIDIPIKILPKRSDIYFDLHCKLQSTGKEKGKRKLCYECLEKITGFNFGFICWIVLKGWHQNECPVSTPGRFLFNVNNLEHIYESPTKHWSEINFHYVNDLMEGQKTSDFYINKDFYYVAKLQDSKFDELEQYVSGDMEYAQECIKGFQNNFLNTIIAK